MGRYPDIRGVPSRSDKHPSKGPRACLDARPDLFFTIYKPNEENRTAMRRKEPEQTLEEFLTEPAEKTRARKARQRHEAAEARLAQHPTASAVIPIRTKPKPVGIQVVEDDDADPE